jgi:hypothetical protein
MKKDNNFSTNEYEGTMQEINRLLKKATELGGFKHLSSEEKNQLKELSIVAEQFEDNTPLFPIL